MGAPDCPRDYLAEHWDAKSPASYTWSDQRQHNQTRQAAPNAHGEVTGVRFVCAKSFSYSTRADQPDEP